MPRILAYNYRFSITITIYSMLWERIRTTNCKFFLRNLRGDSQEAQIEHAQEIAHPLIEELYYLIGFGIDKSVIRMGGTKVDEVVYPELKPKEPARFEALLFRFSPSYRYEWVKDGQKKRYILEDEAAQGWQPQAVASSFRSTESFRLPVIVSRRKEGDEGFISFFRLAQFLTKKRRRNPYGFRVTYDEKDEIFQRFLTRFDKDGNLAFGEKGFFKGERSYVEITGRFWPESKAKGQKGPRRSVLASRPSDNTDYVYLIRAGRTNIYKIGKTNDPQGRLDSLQTASPYKLKLVHTFRAENATAAEEELHRLLHSHRMGGEWFKLTPQQKNRIVSVEVFREGLFWISQEGVKPDDLFWDDRS